MFLNLPLNLYRISKMTIAVIVIKGDHLAEQTKIIECFNYIDLKHEAQYERMENAVNYLLDNYHAYSEEDKALWAIWVDNGWTVIYDPEMVNLFEEEALLSLTEKINTEVFTFIIQSTSNSFGFAKYNQRAKEREFMVVDGTITADFGTPISEESNLNINEQTFIDDIVSLALRIGVDILGNKKQNYIVKQLGYSETLKSKLAGFKQAKTHSTGIKAKSWWRFW